MKEKTLIITQNRIPKDFFITSGRGESNISIHTGSFDKALKKAGIYNCNIIFYSSILPKESREIEKPPEMPFGCVLETIMAVSHGKKGQRTTAGLIWGWIYKHKKKIGGLVAEYHGHKSETQAKKILEKSLNEMFCSRFDEKKYTLENVKIRIESFIPKLKYGTAIVAICFVNFIYPLNNY